MDTLVSGHFYLQQPSQNSVWTPKQAVYLLILIIGYSHKLPWAPFLKGSETLHILNINRGLLHTRGFWHIHLSVFRYSLIKNGLAGPKVSGAFKKWTPGHFAGVRFSLFLCFALMSADSWKELGLTMKDTWTLTFCKLYHCILLEWDC